ncbi:MAG: NHLP family bacteriocin export ABC transporter peptidase/permease/ATPase subunit [Lachnospiraceae bacterium]|nr:NHLP family bacteriocin export ABC transporter peptidase/permease/ATPase subunit [Lachnospiraceae bacterium]
MQIKDRKKIRQPVSKGIARVPVVMQMEALECGAASLTMVLSYFGKWVPLEQVREDCGVSRDGAKAGNILRAAKAYGLAAKGFRYEPEQLKEYATYPCIIHWDFNHFVVLKGFKNGKAYINDPARGDIVVSAEDFDKSFTGVCIVFAPGEGFEPSGNQKSMLAFARKRMKGAGSAVAFVAITTSITSVAAIFAAGFARFFMDELLPGNNPNLVNPFMCVLALLTAIQILAAWITAVYSLRVSGKFAAVGNTTYFWHVMQLPMRFFSQRFAGDIEQRRLSNETIAALLVNTFAPLVINTAMLVFYLGVMLSYSVVMTVIGLVSIIINVLVAIYVSSKRINVTRVMMRDEAKLYSTTLSGIEMIETIKSSGAENGFFRKWSGYEASVNTQHVKYARLDAYLGKIPKIVMALVNDIVLITGVYLIIKGQFTSGMVLAFQGFLMQFLLPAQSLIDAGQQLQEMRSEMERIDDVMEYPKDPVLSEDNESGKARKRGANGKLSGKLELRNVTFGYSRLSPPLIEDFSLSLDTGKSVAFVGSSGCGKSTLSRLISGLYSPWSGEVLFDGMSVSEIDRDSFTGSVAVVDQDITLFEDTIANNIKMWDSSIEDFEMILAARDAQLHEDIMKREGGYQYRLMDGGRDFSGGQRQRMEIARVLAQDPTIIIMDEATSALDAQAEYDVVSSVKKRGITCVVVAHRLSTIRDCDEIIVLDKGKVVERGTHNELMALNGMYTKLVTSE